MVCICNSFGHVCSVQEEEYKNAIEGLGGLPPCTLNDCSVAIYDLAESFLAGIFQFCRQVGCRMSDDKLFGVQIQNGISSCMHILLRH